MTFLGFSLSLILLSHSFLLTAILMQFIYSFTEAKFLIFVSSLIGASLVPTFHFLLVAFLSIVFVSTPP